MVIGNSRPRLRAGGNFGNRALRMQFKPIDQNSLEMCWHGIN